MAKNRLIQLLLLLMVCGSLCGARHSRFEDAAPEGSEEKTMAYLGPDFPRLILKFDRANGAIDFHAISPKGKFLAIKNKTVKVSIQAVDPDGPTKVLDLPVSKGRIRYKAAFLVNLRIIDFKLTGLELPGFKTQDWAMAWPMNFAFGRRLPNPPHKFEKVAAFNHLSCHH
jgi:hypothetical protein